MHTLSYKKGCDAALQKLGVSNEWIAKGISSGVRKNKSRLRGVAGYDDETLRTLSSPAKTTKALGVADAMHGKHSRGRVKDMVGELREDIS